MSKSSALALLLLALPTINAEKSSFRGTAEEKKRALKKSLNQKDANRTAAKSHTILMDVNLGVIMGGMSLVIHLIDAVIKLVNHRRCRSHCCGREGEVSVDIGNTSPKSCVPRLKTGGTAGTSCSTPPTATESSVALGLPWGSDLRESLTGSAKCDSPWQREKHNTE